MVQFTPYENPNRDPSYLGYSKERDGPLPNKLFGAALEGIGDLVKTGVTVADQTTKEYLDKTLASGIDKTRQEDINLNKEVVGNILVASQSPTEARTGVSSTTGTSTGSDGKPLTGAPEGSTTLPAPLGKDIRLYDKLTEGLRQGMFDSDRYFGEMQQITQNLISRYPGYRDYITDKATHYLGGNAANEQRTALQQTIRQLLGNTASADDNDKWQKEVVGYGKYFDSKGEWVTAALNTNDPAGRARVRAQASARMAEEQSFDRYTKGLEANIKEGNVTENSVIQHAGQNFGQQYSQMIQTTMMAAGDFKGNVNDIHTGLALQRLNKTNDPSKNAEYALAIGGMEAQWDSNFEKEWVKPRFNLDPKTGQFIDSYNSLVKDPSKKAQIAKQYKGQFDSLKQQVGSGLFDLATFQSTLSSQNLDNKVAELYANRTALTMSAASKIYGPAFNEIIGMSNVRTNWQLNTELSNSLLKSALGTTLVNGAKEGNNLNTQLNKYEEAARNDPKVDAKQPPAPYVQGLIGNLHAILTSPETVPLAIKVNAAEVISNPATPIFIDKLQKDQQFRAYGALYAPEVTDYIKKRMATEVWDRYKQTGGQIFSMAFGTYANDISKAVQGDFSGKFEWNPSTQQIIYTPRFQGSTNAPVQQAVNRVNEGLRVYGSLLAADKEKITPEVLRAIGVNLDKAPVPSPTFEQMLATLRSIPPMTPLKETKGNDQGSREAGGNTRIPRSPREPLVADTPRDNSAVAAPYLTPLSKEEIQGHIGRSLTMDGRKIEDKEEIQRILEGTFTNPDGNRFYRKGNKWYKVNL